MTASCMAALAAPLAAPQPRRLALLPHRSSPLPAQRLCSPARGGEWEVHWVSAVLLLCVLHAAAQQHVGGASWHVASQTATCMFLSLLQHAPFPASFRSQRALCPPLQRHAAARPASGRRAQRQRTGWRQRADRHRH